MAEEAVARPAPKAGLAGQADAAAGEGAAEDTAGGTTGGNADESPEEHDQPQNAWAARRDLLQHTPRTLKAGADARFGGSMVGGDQHGVSGGHVAGDVIMGSKTEIYQFGVSAVTHASGEVPPATLERLADVFVTDESVFGELVERLRAERVLVLSGVPFSGRRTAALMLLHRLGRLPLRSLVRDTTPTALAQQLGSDAQPTGGYVLCDLETRRDLPLREPHLLAARDRLEKDDAYLVVTVGPSAALEDVTPVEWVPPAPDRVLAAHLRVLTDETTAGQLLDQPAVRGLLTEEHSPPTAGGRRVRPLPGPLRR